MMLNVRLLGIGLLGLLLAPTSVPGRDHGHAAEIVGLVARYDSSWNRQDTVALRRLLAPEYQYFTSRGRVWSRAELLRLVGSPSYVLQQARRSDVAVTRRPPAAVVSSRWEGQGAYQGKPFTDDQRCGQVWLQTAGEWHLLSEHCIQIVPPASSDRRARLGKMSVDALWNAGWCRRGHDRRQLMRMSQANARPSR